MKKKQLREIGKSAAIGLLGLLCGHGLTAGRTGRKSVPVVAISGVKNSGKTTFIEGILPILNEKGIRTAVIKHDGHSFEPDVAGTDSFRARQAGAAGVAVYCGTHSMLIREGQTTAEELMRQFPDADLILCEGMKHSAYPKIELVRAGNSAQPMCAPETLLAVATDLENTDFPARVIGLNDYEAAVELILRLVNK